jgi:hypothetical protein
MSPYSQMMSCQMMMQMTLLTMVRTWEPTHQFCQLPPNPSLLLWYPITLLLCQTLPHPLFLCPQQFWSLSHQACFMSQQPGQNENVSLVDLPHPPTLSKLKSTHFHKHTVTSHNKLWNSVQKIRHSKLTVLSWELRSRISNSDSIPRRINLKSGTNSMSI